MAAALPLPVRRLCGVFCAAEEPDPAFRGTAPSFESSRAHADFMARRGDVHTNPDRPELRHIITTLVTWQQVQMQLLGTRERYFRDGVPAAPADGGGGLDPPPPRRPPLHVASGTPPLGEPVTAAAAAAVEGAEQQAEARDAGSGGNRFAGGAATAGVRAGVARRLGAAFHRPGLDHGGVLATLRYLFFHMRCGIYVMIRDNQVCHAFSG